jgi:riboflavin biosynthesis pyrimidine reductase
VQQLRGPGSAFVCLFDAEGDEGLVLPPQIQAIYGPWPIPRDNQLPYTYVNFVVSRDGRVSFNEPGKSSGGPISGHNRHDRWLMALLRARADAVLIGASALEYAPRQTWHAQGIFPDDAAAWEELRHREGRRPIALHVIATRSGKIRRQSPVLQDPSVPALVVSNDAGVRHAREQIGTAPNVEFLSTGEHLDYRKLVAELGRAYRVKTLLSEAGPHVYAALLEANVVDDEFLTLSPIIAGNSAGHPRPGLVEGVAFSPDTPPRSRLLALYRSGDHLFLHSRYK